MKQILVLLIMLSSFSCYSQVYKFRAFQSKMVPTNEEVRRNNPTSWDSSNLLIVLNLDKQKLHVYAEKETDIDIVRHISTNEDKENKETWIIDQGVNQEGEDCKIITRLMPTDSFGWMAVLFIEYPVATYIFKLKKNN